MTGSFGVSVTEQQNPMRDEDWAHIERVKSQQSDLMERKYIGGRTEHGGDCWAKSGMLAHALDEAADLPVYLWTLRQQLLDLAGACDQQGEVVTAARIRFIVNK